jgi:hypothetical protein
MPKDELEKDTNHKVGEIHSAIFGGEGQVQYQLSRFYNLFYGIGNIVSMLKQEDATHVNRNDLITKLEKLTKG